MSRETQEESCYDDQLEDSSLRLSGQPMEKDVTFCIMVVFFLSPKLEGGERSEVGHLKVEIGDGDIPFGSIVRR